MTKRERIRQALDSQCLGDPGGANSLIALAYYMGAETATRQLSDQYTAKIAAMRERADAVRYHILAHNIIGDPPDYIYSPHYAGDVTAAFAGDEIDR